MKIECKGHSKFLITLMSGYRIVTDPFDASTGYPVGRTSADAVLISHHHHDHDAVDTIEGYTKVIDTKGVHTLEMGCQVTGLSSFHDAQEGKLRGNNLIYVIEADGLRLAHLGDLGHVPDDRTFERLGQLDLLFIPVGGYYTIDAETAVQICERLHPRIVIPMHYKTSYNASWPIAGEELFLELYRKRTGTEAERLNLLRVTKEDIDLQPKLCILQGQFS